MKPFRETIPQRTYTKTHSNYRDYKPYLAKDFNYRCGYTDCSDFWFGGKNNFHIDHFVPWKKHITDKPHLKTDYSNLVYCCSYVNILKSDDEGIYIDPCNEDYNQHFQRDDDGAIIPLTTNAKYMYNKLKLYLERYRIIWLLDQLDNKMDKLQTIIEMSDNNEAKVVYLQLSFAFNDYRKYLKKINE
ncbi:MAG: HNH endonuclease [Prevotellaceae bacterium]|jgi:hypothetical protein|nr:HNH endonuclease [Prevotellaceae bacterium]